MPKKLEQNEVISEIESDGNYKVEFIEYKNQKSKIKIRHLSCNREFEIDYDHWHNRKQRCPYCAKEAQHKTNDDFLNKVKELNITKYTFLEEYKNKKTKILVKCNDCGNTFSILPCNIYNGACQYCAAIKRSETYRHTIDEINNILSEKRPGYKLFSTVYTNNKDKLLFQHSCGEVFEATFSQMISKCRAKKNCPKCFSNESQEEKNFLDEINSYGFSFHKFKDPKDKRIEIDGFDSNLNIGIEFNGLYWHSNKFNKENSHNTKKDYFEKQGVKKIINVFENEYLYNKDETIKKILNSLNNIHQTEEIIKINLQYENIMDYPDYDIVEIIPPEKHFINTSTYKDFSLEETPYFIYDCGYLILKRK